MSDLPHWWEDPEEGEDFLTGIYCGKCGLELIWSDKEESDYCPRCGLINREQRADLGEGSQEE